MSTVVNKVNFVDIRFILACKKNCLPESVLQMSCQLRWTAPFEFHCLQPWYPGQAENEQCVWLSPKEDHDQMWAIL